MATEVEAQIAGNIWKIEKAVGDVVEIDDVIMIIESMKMEIPVLATENGTILEFATEETEPVSEGQVVVILET